MKCGKEEAEKLYEMTITASNGKRRIERTPLASHPSASTTICVPSDGHHMATVPRYLMETTEDRNGARQGLFKRHDVIVSGH